MRPRAWPFRIDAMSRTSDSPEAGLALCHRQLAAMLDEPVLDLCICELTDPPTRPYPDRLLLVLTPTSLQAYPHTPDGTIASASALGVWPRQHLDLQLMRGASGPRVSIGAGNGRLVVAAPATARTEDFLRRLAFDPDR
jgi:hypothetical protein